MGEGWVGVNADVSLNRPLLRGFRRGLCVHRVADLELPQFAEQRLNLGEGHRRGAPGVVVHPHAVLERAGADERAECNLFSGIAEIADAIIRRRAVASNADPNTGIAMRALAFHQIADDLANILFFADNTWQRIGYGRVGLK